MGEIRTPVRAATPVVREIFETIQREGMEYTKLAVKAGIYKQHPVNWKRGENSPRVDLLEAFANAAGYTLTIKKLKPPKQTKKPAK